jgi:hypothetical protein
MALSGRETLLSGLRQDYHRRANPSGGRHTWERAFAAQLPDGAVPFNTNGLDPANRRSMASLALREAERSNASVD